jgi:DNA-directed RNA polymerase subunit omega
MIKPISDDLLSEKQQNRYALVIGVSKRARMITEDASKNKEVLDDKPVEIAVQELLNHKYTLQRPDGEQ